MNRSIDLDALIASISGDNPAGEDLRYTLYDEIKEAKRSDDNYERGDWQRELKRADWDAVITLCVDALTTKTKDLQIAAWLTEALTVSEGFEGLLAGLKTINSYLTDHWDHVYPEIEDEDLDYRIGSIEFFNNSLSARIKQVPVTDSNAKAGYSWFEWHESREVGYETDAQKKEMRAELISEGKLTAEEFDAAVAVSPKAFYVSLDEHLSSCREEFALLDKIVDQKFGADAPRLAEFRDAIDDLGGLVGKILKEKRELEPDPEPENESEAEEASHEETDVEENAAVEEFRQQINSDSFPGMMTVDSASQEKALWQNATATLKSSGINKALGQLLSASSSAPSVREKNRYRLLMAKLCLQANRPDLARPIVEELNALIEELNLERWESPKWIADVLGALYQCLTTGEPAGEDSSRAQVLFEKLCRLDVTKAMIYKH